ncbi:MAG: DUF3794 domain-containing protein [Clostridia bacterium]|nr:DUF3794 domain-containing protein [Clostridia bacterium]
MELNHANHRILCHTGGVVSQTVIEGEVSLPVGRPEMVRVLMVRGRAETGSVESLDQRAMTDGTLTLSVCYLDQNDRIISFESASTFKHTADVPGAQAGMRGTAQADVSAIEVSMLDGRRLNVQAVIDIYFDITDEVDLHTLTAPEEGALCVKTQTLCVERRAARAVSAAEVSDSVEIAPHLPAAVQVLDCRGQAHVQQAFSENELLCIEGELVLTITYTGDSTEDPVSQCFARLPFSEMLPAPGAERGQRVQALCKVRDLYARVEEDGRHIAVEAVCGLELVADHPLLISAVTDAYAIGKETAVTTKHVRLTRCAAMGGGTRALQETVPIDRGGEVARVQAVFASPSCVKASAGEGCLVMETVFTGQMIYLDRDGQVQSCEFQWPARLEEEMEGVTPNLIVQARIWAEQVQVMPTGEGLDVRVLANWSAQALSCTEQSVVEQIVVTDREQTLPSGIVVYFASGQETMWDIAKQYGVRLCQVQAVNPEAQDPLTKGQKLILLRRRAE